MPIQLTKFYLVSLLLIINIRSLSQQILADSSSSLGYKSAVAFYNDTLHEELNVFNGREDKGYVYKFVEGTPYFITDSWAKGTLNYEGKPYADVSLLYDVFKDELVYLYLDKISRVRLSKEKVSGFFISGHHFIQLTPDSVRSSSLPAGFYDELYHSSVSLLVKRTKNIQSFIRQTTEEFKVFSKDHYYLRKRDNYFAVGGKKSFLQNLSDKRKELQQYIKQNKLNFKKNPEMAMIQTLAYYDQLINK